jgi:hypothetical protein
MLRGNEVSTTRRWRVAIRLALHWDRGRLARLKRRLHSRTSEPVHSDIMAFNAGARDARGPSKERPELVATRHRDVVLTSFRENSNPRTSLWQYFCFRQPALG